MAVNNVIKLKSSILLAEGDRFLSKVISNKLLRNGFEVSLANDGIEALNKIKTENFDLVLLDLTLTKKSGLEVLTDLRRDKKIKVPIVVLLNLNTTSDIEKIKKLGITDYIVKSDLSIDMLTDKVKSMLK